MATSESDIELLDTYLDGAMPEQECETLWRRLAEEPELAAELERCRADRGVRMKVFQSMEPSERSVESLQMRVARATRRDAVMDVVLRAGKIVAAAAACIFFGFSVGWLGRAKYPAVAAPDMAPAGNIHFVGNNASSAESEGQFIVNVQDESGNIVATQHFKTAEEARRFADAVQRAQSRPQAQPSTVTPVSTQF